MMPAGKPVEDEGGDHEEAHDHVKDHLRARSLGFLGFIQIIHGPGFRL